MKAEFICHPDFENEAPIDVFHKEYNRVAIPLDDPKFSNRHFLFRKNTLHFINKTFISLKTNRIAPLHQIHVHF